MYLYIQMWEPRPAWASLTKTEREEVVARLGPELQDLTNEGAEFVGWGERDKDTAYPSNETFFAVWKLPSRSFAKTFERIFDEAEWNVYFEQCNCRGQMQKHERVLSDLCIV